MSGTPRSQVFLLAALVVVLAGLVVYQFWGGSPAATGTMASNQVPQGTTMDAGTEPVSHVRLDLLTKDAPAYSPPKRNPFRYYVPPPPPVVRRSEPPPPPPPPPPGPPPPPPIRLRYVGSLTKSDLGLVVMLRDEASGVMHTAQAGQVVDGRYRLLSVTQDAVEVAHLDGRGRQRIPRER
jgi:hypothetical protein